MISHQTQAGVNVLMGFCCLVVTNLTRCEQHDAGSPLSVGHEVDFCYDSLRSIRPNQPSLMERVQNRHCLILFTARPYWSKYETSIAMDVQSRASMQVISM